MSEDTNQITPAQVNVLAGKVANANFITDASNADIRPDGTDGGNQFLMPSQAGVLRSAGVFRVRSLYVPDTADSSSVEEQVRHVVGLPVKPMLLEKAESEDGVKVSPTITVTGFKGYGAKSSKPTAAAISLLTMPDPKAGIGDMIDKFLKEFLSLWFIDGRYDPEHCPTSAALEDFLNRYSAKVQKVKGMARSGTDLKNNGIVEQTFIVSPTAVAFPAKYNTGKGEAPIVFQLTAESAKLVNPDYFGNTQPRLAYTAWWEMEKYFGRGPLAPLDLIAMYHAWGPTGTAQNVPQFLETVMAKVNSMGKFAYSVRQGNKATGLDKAERYSVVDILASVFNEMTRYVFFDFLRPSLSMSEMTFDVKLEWYNEYNEEFGGAVVAAEARHMEYMGCPSKVEGGKEIRAWPFLVYQEGTVLEESCGYGLTPLRFAPAGVTMLAEPNALRVQQVGWMKGEGMDVVPRPTIPAQYDPEIGLIADSEVCAFLDIAIQGEVFVGWVRRAVYDSPKMFRLAVSRTTNHRYNLGYGPITALDPLVDTNCAYDGNLVPFVFPMPRNVKHCVDGTYIFDPKMLLDSMQKKDDATVKQE